MNNIKMCQTCCNWESSIEYEFYFNDGFDGVCMLFSEQFWDTNDNSHKTKALAICWSEGITGEFITKKTFCCSEYCYDENYKQRKLESDWEYYDKLDRLEIVKEMTSEEKINKYLTEIRQGIKNNEFVDISANRLYWFELNPSEFKTIGSLMTEEEKKQYRKLYEIYLKNNI